MCLLTVAAQLGDRVELLLVVFTQRVSTQPRPPAPAPASAPAQLLCVLLLGGQQEHHAAGHQDVPHRVDVVVVVLRLGENVQANPDEGAERSGGQEEDPALPGGRVAVSAPDPPVHLSTQPCFSFTPSTFRPSHTHNMLLLMLTQVTTMNRMAQRTGPSRFHRPLRSSCMDMAISRAPSRNRVYRQEDTIRQEHRRTAQETSVSYIFDGVRDTSHAQNGDPDGAHGAQEVTVLQGVVVHDAQNCHARLVTRMVELQNKQRDQFLNLNDQ